MGLSNNVVRLVVFIRRVGPEGRVEGIAVAVTRKPNKSMELVFREL
jgi:hypothetical protein